MSEEQKYLKLLNKIKWPKKLRIYLEYSEKGPLYDTFIKSSVENHDSFVDCASFEKWRELQNAVNDPKSEELTSQWIEANFGPIQQRWLHRFDIYFQRKYGSDGDGWTVLDKGVKGNGLRLSIWGHSNPSLYLWVHQELVSKQESAESKCIEMDHLKNFTMLYICMTLHPPETVEVIDLLLDPNDDHLDLDNLPITWAPVSNRKRQPFSMSDSSTTKRLCVMD
jgi:hypothetical protein